MERLWGSRVNNGTAIEIFSFALCRRFPKLTAESRQLIEANAFHRLLKTARLLKTML